MSSHHPANFTAAAQQHLMTRARAILQARVPRILTRRWNALAAPQLCERLAQLEAENEELRRRAQNAEADAEHWYENAMALVRQADGEPGITMAGNLVVVPAEGAR